MGHNLGMGHTVNPLNPCSPRGPMGGKRGPWSPCSAMDFKTMYTKNSDNWCFQGT